MNIQKASGWKNSLIGPVLITGLNSKKTALLVNQQGCVNPEMRSICPRHPQKINPLITELQFRAFLFQDSPQGDEMVVSVRTQGCLNVADCSKAVVQVWKPPLKMQATRASETSGRNSIDQSCLDPSNPRTKRTLPIETYSRNKTENEHVEHVNVQDWETQFKFKVEPISHRATKITCTMPSHLTFRKFRQLVNEAMEELELDSGVLLEDSRLCRLCSEENQNGISLYEPNDNAEGLFTMVNTYLPLKVISDDLYPKTICPGCHIQLEATKLFMDLIIQGQQRLRDLLKSHKDQCYREEKERQKLEQALQNHNPNTSVETYAIQTDENGEKYLIQSEGSHRRLDGPLFLPDHQLVLRAEGLDKPKRKRGRPPKAAVAESTPTEPPIEELDPGALWTKEVDKNIVQTCVICESGRFHTCSGPPCVRMKEGIVDDETDNFEQDERGSNEKRFTPTEKNEAPKAVVGKVLEDHGEEMVEQLVFMKTKPVHEKVKKRAVSKPKYTCEICKKEFQHYGRCEMHKRSHKLKFGCEHENCSVQDESREVIVNHQNETGHQGISAFELISKINGIVQLPDAIDVSENILIGAKRFERNDNVYQCDKCEKSFTCKQNYEVHFKAVHDEKKTFQCEICDKFMCNKCNKSFKHRQLLLRHQTVHSDDRPFKCEQCSRQFKSKTNLTTHEKVHQGIKQFVCPICGNMFVHKASLWVHLKWHNGVKPFKCTVCNKAFSQKGNLVEHERIHTGDKPFECNLCGRAFTTSSQHKLHMKRHTGNVVKCQIHRPKVNGEKPFTCKYCLKSFLHKDIYDTHIRRHLGEKPFHCKYCPKTFPEQWACVRHERVHLGVKKYKCDVCNKAFSDGSNLKKHKKIHLKNDAASLLAVQKPAEVPSSSAESQLAIISDDLIPVIKTQNGDLKTMPLPIHPSDLQIHDLLDHEGNATNITTADGQPILIVSSGNKNFQGLLPDGRLVNFNILSNEQSEDQDEEDSQQELIASSGSNLLNSELQFLEDNCNSVTSEDKQTFISEDGKVCFITGFDENSFLTMS
ncbi:hypothetical protein YQE_06108, partial [Dendroctonus ponderosae]